MDHRSTGSLLLRIPVLVAFLLIPVSCTKKPATTAPRTDGDPRIVFVDSAGRTLTESDLKDVTGTFRWEIRGGVAPPARAKELHEEARKLGSEGKYEDALKLLEEARALAPSWEYPPYDEAWTYLLLEKPDKALELYRRVNEMAPSGFFTVKTAIDCLEREASGSVPPGTYKLLVLLEDCEDVEKKTRLLDSILKKCPDLPLALKERAFLLPEGEEQDKMIDKALSFSPDPETRGVLLISRAIRLSNTNRKEEAISMLGTLALDPASTLATAALAKFTLKQIQR